MCSRPVRRVVNSVPGVVCSTANDQPAVSQWVKSVVSELTSTSLGAGAVPKVKIVCRPNRKPSAFTAVELPPQPALGHTYGQDRVLLPMPKWQFV